MANGQWPMADESMSKSKSKSPDPRQPVFAFLAVTAVPQGDGSYLVRPGKPVQECGPAEAARMLCVARSSLCNLLNRPVAQKYIRWRWLSEARGKRLFEVESLAEYKAALGMME